MSAITSAIFDALKQNQSWSYDGFWCGLCHLDQHPVLLKHTFDVMLRTGARSYELFSNCVIEHGEWVYIVEAIDEDCYEGDLIPMCLPQVERDKLEYLAWWEATMGSICQ